VNLLTAGSDYGALGNALNQACTNTVGTLGITAADCTQVNNAVQATEMLTEAAASDTTITSGPSGLVNDATPTWTFVGSANRTPTGWDCSIDTGTPSFSSCSGPGGSHTPASNLSDGSYTFRVRARVGSNIDPTPATQTFSLDATPPDTIIDSGPSGPINDTTPSFSFHSTEASSTFECSVDQGTPSFGACSGPGASHTPASLADGNYTFRVQATDQAGNTDQSPAIRSFTVDTIPPETTIDSGPSGLTNDTTPTFEFSSNEPGSSFGCRVDGVGAFTLCTSPITLAPLSDGFHSFEVVATDQATNTDPTPASRSFEVRHCTISGNDSANTIVGTRFNDVICGFGGNDKLTGAGGTQAGGNDIIFGGTGNDTINDNLGNNRLWGEQGADKITAGLGNDELNGGDGSPDVCAGGFGIDTAVGCESVSGIP
ncbi:MAG: Ig-like domain-containing protein, partial [Nocardioidaceae bacterium]